MATFYYLASKVFWLFFQPINFLLFLNLLGALMLFTRCSVAGRMAVFLSTLALVTIAFTPIGLYGLDSVESVYERPSLPDRVDGILVLGGGVDWLVAEGRGTLELSSAGDRITHTVILANKFPNAKIIYSGKQGLSGESEDGKNLSVVSTFVELGIARDRIVIEPNARNTLENVHFSYQLIRPKPDDTWLVVTSAFHMQRAMEIFSQKQWGVIPWPVDYRSPGSDGQHPFFYDTPTSILNVNLAFKEWVGLFLNTHLKPIRADEGTASKM